MRSAGFLLGLAWVSPAATVDFIRIDGAIGPATASYIARAVEQAGVHQAQCLIIELDTPGGLLDSTKQIVQSFYSAKIPTVVYVAPTGANAGSAGCFITLAADIAAMAPNTSLGAAHPVSIGAGGGEDKTDDVMKKKLENFATSYIEAIAQKRHRNIEWAKSSVRDSASITAEKALELNVIEIIARDRADLLKQIDGREISGRRLQTASAEIREIPRSASEKLFQMLWRPEVMFLLMLAAMYGLIGELSNPGAILPGVAGTIALILFLYMSAVLPINVAGVALIFLAAALFIIDVFAPTHGVLTGGGIVAFFLGALMMFDRAGAGFHLSITFILPATLATAAFFIFVVAAGLRAQWLPVRVGREAMIGKTAACVAPITQQAGKVFVEGEYWNALSDTPVAQGESVEIVGASGLTLRVKPKNQR